MGKVKGRSTAKVRRRLEKALRRQSLLRIHRGYRKAGDLEGFVVGLGREWVLLALLGDGVHLNGHVALRLAGLSTVTTNRKPGSFIHRALQARGEWPPEAVDVDLDSAAGVVRSAALLQPLVTLHIEAIDAGVAFIGRPVKVGRRRVHLLEVDPEAEWWPVPTTWRLDDLTRVDFGGDYEEALTLIAGPPPDPQR
ncbi:MAG TPA: hypothetical protein VE781_06050 [Kineosporiaceae bacterium]|jgi:hypothetical protein|nr:hypothetical protein [Kineosporiaceae bacterium]